VGDRALRRIVWALTALLLAFALGLAAIRFQYCSGPYAHGRVAGALLVGFLLAGIGSIVWNRLHRRPPRFTSAFLASAAIISASAQMAAFAGDKEKRDGFVNRSEACLATGSPFVPLEGLSYREPPPAMVAGLDSTLPEELEPSVEMRIAHDGNRPVAVLIAAAIGNEPGDQSDFMAGVMATAGGRPTTLGGRPVLVQRGRGRSMVTGIADCYGIVVVASGSTRAHALFQALRRPPGTAGSRA
jgi:hypothetical protein